MDPGYLWEEVTFEKKPQYVENVEEETSKLKKSSYQRKRAWDLRRRQQQGWSQATDAEKGWSRKDWKTGSDQSGCGAEACRNHADLRKLLGATHPWVGRTHVQILKVSPRFLTWSITDFSPGQVENTFTCGTSQSSKQSLFFFLKKTCL